MKYLSNISENELKKWLQDNNHPPYRAKQILSWIFNKWVSSPMEMKNIPIDLRKSLSDSFHYGESKIIDTENSGDMTEKILLGLADSETVENVIIRTEERTTFCLSTQVGCPVQCRFCASGIGGLVRNLTSAEIIDHLLTCCRKADSRPDNIVFMGIGEPLLNIKNLISALEIMTDENRFGISPRRITISTSGWSKGIKQIAELKKPYNLALSLHGTDDKIRSKLIPDKFRRPLDEILDACIEYREKTGRMITFEYTLIKNINDSLDDASKLAKLAKKHRTKVNLIPFNEVDATGFERPEDDSIKAFMKILTDAGIQATCRLRKGDNINAACGQLRRRKNEST